MKKLFIAMITLALVIGISGIAMADGAGAGIAGSPHDFSTETWNGRQEICRVCHVPHDHSRATQRYLNGLLWNHAVSSATYTMYNNAWSSTINGAQTAQPVGVAKLCLGCHDGTVGIDTFDKYAGGTVNITDYDPDFKIPGFTDGANLDLRGTHPISIVYDDAADTSLRDPATTAMGLSGVINDVLDNGRVQCSSCHDVHDQESVANTHLLRVPQTIGQGGVASGLCLTCHIK